MPLLESGKFGRRRLRRDQARDLWFAKRRAFARVAASTIMPDHDHLLAYGEASSLYKTYAQVLGNWCDRHGFARWNVATPADSPNFKHLLRQIRYVHLNPCRDQLCRDPMEWEWSTHRDWCGLVLDPWPKISSLAPRLPLPRRPGGFVESFHSYISSDPTTSVTGTPPPVRITENVSQEYGREAVKMAVRIALRSDEESLRKRGREREVLLLALGKATAYRPSELARWAEVSPATATRILSRRSLSDEEWLTLQRILRDPRVLKS